MNTWTDVLNAAIAGKTDATLLQEAAFLSVRRLAGWKAVRLDDVSTETAPSEDQPPTTGAAGQRLSEMLAGTYQELLPEWLDLAGAAGRRVPAHLLPPLLDHGRQHAGQRPRIDAVIGARGRWLAAQNPEWAFGALENLEEAFATGATPARASALRSLRRQNASRARSLLEGTWAKESGDERAALLPALEDGITLADEAFLEGALKDRKRDVREAALELLARLPASGLVTRMRARVAPLLSVKKSLLGSKLTVVPPDQCDEGMLRDGIELKPPQGMGEKAWWLSQMIALVPPSTWPVEIVGPATSSDWNVALLRGWSRSTTRLKDRAWAQALLLQWIDASSQTQQAMGLQVANLLAIIPLPDVEAIVTGAFRRNVDLGGTLLSLCQNWTLDLSRTYVRYLEKMVHDMPSGYRARSAARHCDPRVLDELQAIATRATNPQMIAVLNVVLPALQYRAAMRKELSE